MQNKLSDLNNYLFESIERLNDDSLNEEQLKMEIERSRAVGNIAKNIINIGQLALNAQKHFDTYGIEKKVENPLIEVEENG